ncbi:MAG: DUF6504 family protein [Nocardioides sp.]
MRRYDDPVEVRRGWIGSPGEDTGSGQGSGQGSGHGTGRGTEGPEQFLWRGRLWRVRAVLAHWVETGPWWQSTRVRAVLGTDRQGSH